MLSMLKKYYLENRIVLWSITGLLVLFLIDLYKATANVPLMDYWWYISLFTEKLFSGSISFSDIWGYRTEIHRLPIELLLFLINMAYFHLNVQIEIYLGAIIIAINSMYIYNIFVKTSPMLPRNYRVYRNYMYIFIAIAFFNYNQWEITAVEFSMIFMLKILFFLIVFRSIDKLLLNTEDQKQFIIQKCILIMITICLFASGYFPALIGVITITITINFLLSYQEQKHYVKYYVFIFLSMFLASWIYLFGMIGAVSTDHPLIPFLKDIFNGNLFKGFEVLLSSSITQVFPINLPFVGIALLFIYIIVIYLFFRKKLYKQTFMPIMLIFYTVLIMCEIYFGRESTFGIGGLVASRYVVDTNLGIIGSLWILIEIFVEGWSRKTIFKEKIKSIIAIIMILFITMGLIASCVIESGTATTKRQRSEKLINVMLNKISISEDDLGGLICPIKTNEFQNGVKLMKEYKLGVFETNLSYEKDIDIIYKNYEVRNFLYCNDNNWTNGVANLWGAAFLAYNSSEAREQLKVGKTITFCDGTKREITQIIESGYTMVVYLQGAPLNARKVGYPNQFNIGPHENYIFDCNDNNWVNGVAKSWGAAFLVLNSSETKEQLSVGKTIMFCDGTKREISKVEENGNIIVVFLEGVPLDGKMVGYPNQFSISP